MPIIIDGWNFIRSDSSDIEDIDMDAIESAVKLIKRIERYQASHNDPVVIVFDSRSGHLDTGFKNTSKITVVAAKDADRYIMKYVENVPENQRRNVRVVSSDKQVYHHAKSYYATPIRSDEFWVKLNGKRPEGA